MQLEFAAPPYHKPPKEGDSMTTTELDKPMSASNLPTPFSVALGNLGILSLKLQTI